MLNDKSETIKSINECKLLSDKVSDLAKNQIGETTLSRMTVQSALFAATHAKGKGLEYSASFAASCEAVLHDMDELLNLLKGAAERADATSNVLAEFSSLVQSMDYDDRLKTNLSIALHRASLKESCLTLMRALDACNQSIERIFATPAYASVLTH